MNPWNFISVNPISFKIFLLVLWDFLFNINTFIQQNQTTGYFLNWQKWFKSSVCSVSKWSPQVGHSKQEFLCGLDYVLFIKSGGDSKFFLCCHKYSSLFTALLRTLYSLLTCYFSLLSFFWRQWLFFCLGKLPLWESSLLSRVRYPFIQQIFVEYLLS